jgi:LDH2 family malate/lactate/ureidoglycolate dehydrogenase
VGKHDGHEPLTIGLPTDEEFDFLLDGATSITQRGRIEYYQRLGLPTPAGTVVDQEGNIMTDSAAILKGLSDGTAALTAIGGAGEELGGYKGYGFAAAVEILSAAFTASGFMRALTGMRDGKKCPSIWDTTSSPSTPPPLTVRRASGRPPATSAGNCAPPRRRRATTASIRRGRRKWLAWQERKDKGVAINASVQKELLSIRDELGLSKYVFPFES